MYRLAILGIVILGAGGFLLTQGAPFVAGLGLILALLTLLWILSLLLRDASIIDSFWGPGFAVMAWYGYFAVSEGGIRSLLLCGLVTVWGLRLGLHIALRNKGKGEDFRYQEWRREGGKHYWWISYFRVFVLQGLLLWIISAPLLVSPQLSGGLTPWDLLGLGLWLLGFVFEAVGDWQLTRFKSQSSNKGKVMDKGLWRYTRHPNYFGDALLWWGYFCFAISVEDSWVYVFSPLLMTFLLMQVSGVALLEKTLADSKPEYKEYMEKTSAFFPWFSK